MDCILKNMKMSWLLTTVVLLTTLAQLCCSSKVVLKDNGYENVVVALDNNLPLSRCQDIILGLEVSCINLFFNNIK